AWPSEALVAVMLAAGEKSSEIAAHLLCDLGGIEGLARATIDEIAEVLEAEPLLCVSSGVGARRIAASFELGRRLGVHATAQASITSSADVASWASARLSLLDHEELWLLALDGRS